MQAVPGTNFRPPWPTSTVCIDALDEPVGVDLAMPVEVALLEDPPYC